MVTVTVTAGGRQYRFATLPQQQVIDLFVRQDATKMTVAQQVAYTAKVLSASAAAAGDELTEADVREMDLETVLKLWAAVEQVALATLQQTAEAFARGGSPWPMNAN